MSTEKKELLIRKLSTKEIIRRIDVTGKSDRQIEKVTIGLLHNMSDDYFVDDSFAGEDDESSDQR